MNAKQLLKRMIGDYTVARVKRVVYKFLSGKKKIISNYQIEVISDGFHTSFGYYDHSPVMENELLYYTTDADSLKVKNCCIDLSTKEKKWQVYSDLANWQQGNRLQWISSGNFIFNDFFEGKYI